MKTKARAIEQQIQELLNDEESFTLQKYSETNVKLGELFREYEKYASSDEGFHLFKQHFQSIKRLQEVITLHAKPNIVLSLTTTHSSKESELSNK
jgi:hypothetical protein